MSAGTGIFHSEFNASTTDTVHLLQIWLLPEANGIEPSYEQVYIDPAQKYGRLCLIGSRDGRDGSVTLHQDVSLYATVLGEGVRVEYAFPPGRLGWVQIARGSIRLNDHDLSAGDGAALVDPGQLIFTGTATESEVLLFDMVGSGGGPAI
jgi:redox-sensitive bicupin YhaK (pirin superfamily)